MLKGSVQLLDLARPVDSRFGVGIDVDTAVALLKEPFVLVLEQVEGVFKE